MWAVIDTTTSNLLGEFGTRAGAQAMLDELVAADPAVQQHVDVFEEKTIAEDAPPTRFRSAARRVTA